MEELFAWWWALWGIEQASKKRKRKSYPTTRPKPKRR